MLEIVQIPQLRDNYVYLICDESSTVAAVVDPAEAGPVLAELKRRGWTLGWVLNTHHHSDHVGGNLELKSQTGCHIIGPRADTARIPGIETALADGDQIELAGMKLRVLDVPGHTRGHIAYWLADDDALFCGDTIFALGCGRMFEGDAPTMWASLLKLRALPASTRVYCAHEYTESNLRFAESIEPSNPKLRERGVKIRQLRAQNLPTVPSLLGEEVDTNPFLRADVQELCQAMGEPWTHKRAFEVFGELRRRKDHF